MDIDIRIERRVSSEGHPFMEVFYEYTEPDAEQARRFACTRYWHVLDDTPHARAAEREAFLRRRRADIGRT